MAARIANSRTVGFRIRGGRWGWGPRGCRGWGACGGRVVRGERGACRRERVEAAPVADRGVGFRVGLGGSALERGQAAADWTADGEGCEGEAPGRVEEDCRLLKVTAARSMGSIDGAGGGGVLCQLDGGLVLEGRGAEGDRSRGRRRGPRRGSCRRGEGEVLAGAGDGGTVNVEEELAAVDLIDVDGLADEEGGSAVSSGKPSVLVMTRLRAKRPAEGAKAKAGAMKGPLRAACQVASPRRLKAPSC